MTDKQQPEFDVEAVREDFPILDLKVGAHSLVYLDNAATSQKPRQVIDNVEYFYATRNANIHRGVHYLSNQATEAYEKARTQIAHAINAREDREVIFVRGATEAINLVASSWGKGNLREGDEILLTELEHHANIVPWQLAAERVGAKVVAAPIDDNGDIVLEEFEKRLTDRVRIVGVGHVSNALGTVNPVEEIIRMAHARGIPVMLDSCQSLPHFKVDVQALDCDFMAFSGHKIFGPTGIGCLYGKAELLEKMPPYQGGGDMIAKVSFEKSTFREIPERFEAGTPNIAGAIGLATAFRYLERLGHEQIRRYEEWLVHYALEQMQALDNIQIIGMPKQRAGVISFLQKGTHPHDTGTHVNNMGVAIRAGHHCAQPLMRRLGLAATARASFAFYNTKEEADILCNALKAPVKLFS